MRRRILVTASAMLLAAQLGSPVAAAEPSSEQLSLIAAYLEAQRRPWAARLPQDLSRARAKATRRSPRCCGASSSNRRAATTTTASAPTPPIRATRPGPGPQAAPPGPAGIDHAGDPRCPLPSPAGRGRLVRSARDRPPRLARRNAGRGSPCSSSRASPAAPRARWRPRSAPSPRTCACRSSRSTRGCSAIGRSNPAIAARPRGGRPAAPARAAGGPRRHHRPAQPERAEVRRRPRPAAERGAHRRGHPRELPPPGRRRGVRRRHCLGLVAARTAGGELLLAPVSAANRATVAAWLARRPASGWTPAPARLAEHRRAPAVAEPTRAPPRPPRPPLAAGLREVPAARRPARGSFPPTPSAARMLGADTLLLDPDGAAAALGAPPLRRDAGRRLPRRASTSSSTSPTRCWRESFGRAIAEAIAAGKLVITDPATAATFGPGVVADDGERRRRRSSPRISPTRPLCRGGAPRPGRPRRSPAGGGGRAAPAASRTRMAADAAL